MQAHFEALKVEIRMVIDFGMFKKPGTINGVRELILRIWDMIDDGWKQYVDMDWDRFCVVAKDGYKHNDFINYKFRRI